LIAASFVKDIDNHDAHSAIIFIVPDENNHEIDDVNEQENERHNALFKDLLIGRIDIISSDYG